MTRNAKRLHACTLFAGGLVASGLALGQGAGVKTAGSDQLRTCVQRAALKLAKTQEKPQDIADFALVECKEERRALSTQLSQNFAPELADQVEAKVTLEMRRVAVWAVLSARHPQGQ